MLPSSSSGDGENHAVSAANESLSWENDDPKHMFYFFFVGTKIHPTQLRSDVFCDSFPQNSSKIIPSLGLPRHENFLPIPKLFVRGFGRRRRGLGVTNRKHRRRPRSADLRTLLPLSPWCSDISFQQNGFACRQWAINTPTLRPTVVVHLLERQRVTWV